MIIVAQNIPLYLNRYPETRQIVFIRCMRLHPPTEVLTSKERTQLAMQKEGGFYQHNTRRIESMKNRLGELVSLSYVIIRPASMNSKRLSLAALICLLFGNSLTASDKEGDSPLIGYTRLALIAQLGEPMGKLDFETESVLIYPTQRITLNGGKVTKFVIGRA